MRIQRRHIVIAAVSVILLLSIYSLYNFAHKPTSIPYNDFLKDVNQGQVKEVYLTDREFIEGKYKNNQSFSTDNPRKEGFKEELLKKNVKVLEADRKTQLEKGASLIFSLALLTGLVVFLSRQGAKQTQGGFSKFTSLSVRPEENTHITFDDVAGNEEAKESVKEMVDFLRYPEKFSKYGARMPRGIIFFGPPGTGKTLMAKALAGESDVPFYAVSGSDFVQVYVGVGAGRIRDLFKKAKQHGKCVIFIDEIDAIGKKRDGGADGGGNDERDQTLNALLAEMSGFSDNEGIIVIAATNRLDVLDEALLRPGRFDRHIEIGLPDVNARYKILKLHSNNKHLSDEIDLRKVAQQTVYFSGAKLENMMNEAAIFAARRDAGCIEVCDIDKAFYTVIAGAEKKDRSMISSRDKEITAFHEAGHALITKLVSPEYSVSRVTIIPSTSGIGGFSMSIPPDRMHYSKKDMRNNIQIALAGRASEELIFGEENITSGASNDIEKATQITKSMFKQLGMSKKTGLLNYDILYGNAPLVHDQILLDEIKTSLELLYQSTMGLLIENKKTLEEIAYTLIEEETIDEQTLNNIIKKESIVNIN